MTTIERIARAIEQAECDWENNCPTPFDEPARSIDDYPDRSKMLARAALQALRQVDEGTVKAMGRAFTGALMSDERGSGQAAAFTAAIDHILGENHD